MQFTKSLLEWCGEKGADELLRCYAAGGNVLPPDQIGFSSPATVTFRCPRCDYQWRRSLNKATRKGARLDCPACSGRVPWQDNIWTEQYPELLLQWDRQRNTADPKQAVSGNERSHWHCPRCRNQWTAPLKDRIAAAKLVRSRGGELCPYCGRQKLSPQYNLAVCCPEIARQFAIDLNGGLLPENCLPAGSQNVFWRCSFDHTHVWRDRIANRTLLRRGCPHCARLFKASYTSRVLFYYLRQVFPDCVCEYQEGRYLLDICIPSCGIAIEHHGYIHRQEEARARDIRRRDELLRKGYRHVLWLVESQQPAEGFCRDGDVLTYYNPAPYHQMDKLVRYVLTWLEALIGESIHCCQPDSVRDHFKIEDAYYYARTQRSLAVRFSHLVPEWSEKNGRSPETVLAGSPQKAIWKCAVCGGEFTAAVANRTAQNSGCPYCAGRLPTAANNAAVHYPHLLEDWDGENNDRTLYELLPNTKYLATWRCHTCGHRWKTMLPNRASPSGSGCPVCGRTTPGAEASLAAVYPRLAAFWHPWRNGDVTPELVMAHSSKRWWWRCQEGHEWQGAPNNMAKTPTARLCPYCGNRRVSAENCLAAVNPALADQWHPEKNGSLTPRDVTATAPKAVWWRCEKGHAFRASVYNRQVNHTGCPYCINRKVCSDNCLATVYPQLAQEWHPTKNGALTPRDVTAQSSKQVWWICEKKHEWQMQVSKRSARGQGCPYCAGRLASRENCLAALFPALAEEWDYEANAPLTPEQLLPRSRRRVGWLCPRCGHRWTASAACRAEGRGCPACAGVRTGPQAIPRADEA